MILVDRVNVTDATLDPTLPQGSDVGIIKIKLLFETHPQKAYSNVGYFCWVLQLAAKFSTSAHRNKISFKADISFRNLNFDFIRNNGFIERWP